MTVSKPPAHTGLQGRILRAGGWSLLQVVGTQGLRLVSNLIMTRLLLPEAFGLMAMVGVFISGLNLLTDIGISRSIAREPDGDQPHFLRAAWVIKIGRGATIAFAVVCLGLLLWWFGPILAAPETVYADPRLPVLVILSAIVPLALGLESTLRELAERQLKMHYTTCLEIGTQAIVILAMLGFAAISPTVWALMAGMLTGSLVKAIGTHIFFPGPKMRFVWDKDIADRIWQFGKWLMGSSALSFVAQNADRFFLGAVLNAGTFGIYVIAQVWIQAGKMLVNRLADHVGFPAISEMIRTRPDNIPRLYRKLQTVTDAVCVAGFLSLFLFGDAFIGLLYTDTYSDAGTYLKILSVTFLAMRFNTLNGLIMNMGNSRAMVFISGTRAVVLCAMLPVMYHLVDLRAALFVIALPPLITAPYAIALTRPVLGKAQARFDMLWLMLTLIVTGAIYVYA